MFAQWRIASAVTDQILLQQPQTDFERAAVKRHARSLFQSTKLKEIVAGLKELRGGHLRLLDSGGWTRRELYPDQL
eukprot:6271133-Pyramimonas_sp.AAC.1